jgi:hypothetical protein
VSDVKMPKWPVEKEQTTEHPLLNIQRTLEKRDERIAYALALAAAWEARCRLAVECMIDVQRILVDKDVAHREAVGMYNVLAAIGPLPTLREG